MPMELFLVKEVLKGGTMKKQYDNIQVMRGLAALSVVFMHVQMIHNGAFGVELFYCISGFIMMHVTQKGCEGFFVKRIIRIVPLYWAVTLAMAAILIIAPDVFRTQVFEGEYLLKSLFFIPYYYKGKSGSTVNALLAVGWTLVMEVYYYMVFYVSTRISKKYRHLISSAVLIAVVVIAFATGSKNTFLRFYGQPVMLEFILGMFSYRFLTAEKKKPVTKAKRVIYLLSAAALWCFLYCEKYIPQLDKIDRFFRYGIIAFAVFVLLFRALEDCRIPRFFVVLGNISYSLYLTHSFVVQGFSRLIYNIDTFSVTGAVLVVVAVVPLCLAVAWVSWWVIENRLTGFLRKKLIR